MGALLFSPEADRQLVALRADDGLIELYERVNDVLDDIEDNRPDRPHQRLESHPQHTHRPLRRPHRRPHPMKTTTAGYTKNRTVPERPHAEGRGATRNRVPACRGPDAAGYTRQVTPPTPSRSTRDSRRVTRWALVFGHHARAGVPQRRAPAGSRTGSNALLQAGPSGQPADPVPLQSSVLRSLGRRACSEATKRAVAVEEAVQLGAGEQSHCEQVEPQQQADGTSQQAEDRVDAA